jgi:hypothetical protein
MNWQLILGVGFYWLLDIALMGYGIYLVARVWRYLVSYLDLGRVSKYDR